jgi:hypothetical protein
MYKKIGRFCNEVVRWFEAQEMSEHPYHPKTRRCEVGLVQYMSFPMNNGRVGGRE